MPWACRHFILFLLLISASFLLLFDRTEGFAMLYQNFQKTEWNFVFNCFTFLGDGLFTFLLILYFIIRKNYQLALLILASFLLSGLLVQVLKTIVAFPRPKVYFETVLPKLAKQLSSARGGFSSFPSGHTATAFSLATILIFFHPSNKWGIALFSIAFITGLSRIVLGHHFPLDVFAGAILGILASFTVVALQGAEIFKKSRIKFPLQAE
jgi:membrane-associated phospholipid phosphatase